ncbi:50S ribosomal protein L14e [archaeon]|nr:50S ribosomal protein L14e [archaeon]|tara:strand:+ start:7479 stop:7826 length:348 start_codon:yes stop_codon:yes gene_type:complete
MADLIGRLCVKTTGRESGRECVIVNVENDAFVTIDGNVKRRRCNINHLEFLNKNVDIKKDESTEQVRKAMENLGIKLMTKTKKEKSTTEKPKKQRQKEEEKQKEVKEEKPKKSKK